MLRLGCEGADARVAHLGSLFRLVCLSLTWHRFRLLGQDDPALRFLKAEAAKACKDPSSEDASSSKGAAGEPRHPP